MCRSFPGIKGAFVAAAVLAMLCANGLALIAHADNPDCDGKIPDTTPPFCSSAGPQPECENITQAGCPQGTENDPAGCEYVWGKYRLKLAKNCETDPTQTETLTTLCGDSLEDDQPCWEAYYCKWHPTQGCKKVQKCFTIKDVGAISYACVEVKVAPPVDPLTHY